MNFGIWIQPLDKLTQSSSAPEFKEYQKAISEIEAGKKEFLKLVDKFVTFGEVKYVKEKDAISKAITSFHADYKRGIFNYSSTRSPQNMRENFHYPYQSFKYKILEQIDNIPIEWESKLFQANTPFTAHLCILDYVSTARKRLDYFDRYLNSEFFPLYLRNLNKSIKVRLITTKKGVDNVFSVSNLCHQEFSDYKLIQLDSKDFHDRNLRIDDKIFTLGPGTDIAGKFPTNFGPAESTPNAHKVFDDLIKKGIIIHSSK